MIMFKIQKLMYCQFQRSFETFCRARMINQVAIISFLKPAEYIEIASMKASLKLLNLDVQGQLDVLRPFLLVQLHFFFFA